MKTTTQGLAELLSISLTHHNRGQPGVNEEKYSLITLKARVEAQCGLDTELL